MQTIVSIAVPTSVPWPTGLSDEIIPAVRGEYYAYSSRFTQERPIYSLLKCKSNKNRPFADLPRLGRSANALFTFSSTGQSAALTLESACERGLITATAKADANDETLLSSTNMTDAEFHKLQTQHDSELLIAACKASVQADEAHIMLRTGLVVSMITKSGKYGLFLVSNLRSDSVTIDACHVLS